MYLIDTDVISQITKPKPHAAAMQWLAATPINELHLSVATIVEIRIGIELMAAGRRKQEFEGWLQNDLPQMYRGRIISVDHDVAGLAGELIGRNRATGFADESMDALIAATARVHGLKVATLNRKHFERLGVELVQF
jgi:predicted nucleic acid-binding protein